MGEGRIGVRVRVSVKVRVRGSARFRVWLKL